MPKFSKKEAISGAWNIFKANWVFLVIITVVSMVIGYLPTALSGFYDQQPLISLVVGVIFSLIGVVISLGLMRISLNLIDGKTATYADLFAHWRLILSFIVAQILVGIIVLAGLILLVIPGIIFGIRLQFATYLVVDENLGPLAAVKKSWAMTGGSVGNLFLFGLLIGLIFFAGILALGAGLLVAVPVTGLATAAVYRKLAATP